MTPLRSLNSAVALLTIIPTPDHYPDQPGKAFAYFPLVGLVIGLILAGVQVIALSWLPTGAAGFVTLAAWVLITGGLHLDGFADACDGVFFSGDANRRLEIMKDPHTGTWGTVGLILLLLGKWVLLQSVSWQMLPLITTTGRWVMVIAATVPYARDNGMGGYFRQGLGRMQVGSASLLWLMVVITIGGLLVSIPLVLVVIIAVGMWVARRLGGGFTGDIYGTLCELTELLLLLALNIQT